MRILGSFPHRTKVLEAHFDRVAFVIFPNFETVVAVLLEESLCKHDHSHTG